MDAKQFKSFIVKPVLDQMDLGGVAAVNLLTGTAMVESGIGFVRQIPNGPAVSFFQMEMNTHDDIWENFLKYKKTLAAKVRAFKIPVLNDVQNMQANSAYAVAMCRIHYLRMPEQLPEYDDPIAMARYHKLWYNTPLGKTQIEKSIPLFRTAIQL